MAVLLYIIFLDVLYPVINNLLDLPYSSSIYRTLTIVSFLLVITFFCFKINKSKAISKKMILLITISFIFIIYMFLANGIYPDHGDSYTRTYQLKAVFVTLPSILVAYLLLAMDGRKFFTHLFLINLLISLSLFKFLFNNRGTTILSAFIDFGGVNYNDYSYIAALNIAIGFYLFYNVLSSTRKKSLVLLIIFNLTISYISVVLSGGRGALILSIILFILFIFVMFKQYLTNFNPKQFFFFFLILLSITVVGLSFSSTNEALVKGLDRGFSFLFSDDGLIDWENTSGRFDIYQQSWQLISERPFFGYGIGAVYFIHPTAHFSHNIFLDLFLEGGIILLMLATFLFIAIFIKSIKRILEPKVYLFFSLFLYTFINLLSGSNYLLEPVLWFSITSIILLDKNAGVTQGRTNNASVRVSSY